MWYCTNDGCADVYMNDQQNECLNCGEIRDHGMEDLWTCQDGHENPSWNNYCYECGVDRKQERLAPKHQNGDQLIKALWAIQAQLKRGNDYFEERNK